MKNKRQRIPQTEVLAWLQESYPKLHEAAEIDRDWVWLAVDLRGDSNKAIREAIKEYGFIFHRHGGHLLPSGKLGTWGHSCERPMRFKRQGDGKRQDKPSNHNDPQQPDAQGELTDDAILAMFG